LIAAILLFIGLDLLGNWLQSRLGLPIPGALIGLILLTIVLCLRPHWAGPRLRSGARLLVGSMALFFVPAGTGVITELGEIRGQWLPIAAALFISTAGCLLAANGTMRLLDRALARRPASTAASEEME
jgi:holin-like protein